MKPAFLPLLAVTLSAQLRDNRDKRLNLKTAVGDPPPPFRHVAARCCNEISCHCDDQVRGS